MPQKSDQPQPSDESSNPLPGISGETSCNTLNKSIRDDTRSSNTLNKSAQDDGISSLPHLASTKMDDNSNNLDGRSNNVNSSCGKATGSPSLSSRQNPFTESCKEEEEKFSADIKKQKEESLTLVSSIIFQVNTII